MAGFSLRYVDYPASPDREFPCDLCPLSFDRQHDLKRHIETHSGEKPYLCDRGCGKAFTRKDALKRHQTTFPFLPARAGTSTIPAGDFRRPASCNVSAIIQSSSFLWRRISISICALSSRISPSTTVWLPSSLNLDGPCHAYGGSASYPVKPEPGMSPPLNYAPSFVPPPQHGGDFPASPSRPYPCDACPLSFERHHDLKRHKVTHVGERPYVCNGGCDKTFTRKDALKRHQLSKECGRP
ncbi:hypothetical protein MVEN_00457000 [Mycena venus]|uniref:C2H2-type domain-containing protein n=1 Tax=Mycena venus TaxID=2733690 RepID=A0A8H7D859_9AGAR|nr:hypothetical protein MVEN_00457000 [Mycena venus]